MTNATFLETMDVGQEPGLQVAKLILSGKVEEAKVVARKADYKWSVMECRAISGACKECHKHHGFEPNRNWFF
jgi:hypothetical protein